MHAFRVFLPLWFSSDWKRFQVLLYCLVIVIGVAQCEHDIDLGHLSSDGDVIIPINHKLYSTYLVPFRAADTGKYLSTLRRHKRSVWLVPRIAAMDGNSKSRGSHHRGYRAHQPDYMPVTFM